MPRDRRQKSFNDRPFDSFVFIFGFVWGKMHAESISWCTGFSCFHWLFELHFCSSYWDHVLKNPFVGLAHLCKDICV